jgi:hypothetical protein
MTEEPRHHIVAGSAQGAGAATLSLAALSELHAADLTAFNRDAGSQNQARPGDVCVECASVLVIRDMSYECPGCHAVYEAADIQDVLPVSNPEVVGASALWGRLCIVGCESGWYQPDLDRTNPGESSEAQKKSTYQELLRYNREFGDRGGNPFPLDVLEDVAINYYIIQQQSVKRSMLKKGILAALVFHACISRGFTRTRGEAAELLQLPTHGIARGDEYLRSIDEDCGLEIDMNRDRLRPHIASAFAQLDLTDASYEPLREAVSHIVALAEQTHIGFQSVLRSKVVATSYEVLRRKNIVLSIDEVTKKCGIRKHTLRRFLDELVGHHSLFAEEYRRLGLDSSPPPVNPGGKPKSTNARRRSAR